MKTQNIFGPIGALLGDFGRARRTATVYGELSRLSDEALARRGLARTDIARVAYETGFGN